MPYCLNHKIKNLVPYEPITGEYKIRLDANESYIKFDCDKLTKALDANLNRYPDPYAVDLCRAFSSLYGVSPELVTAGNGSDELIGLIVGAFFTANDTVVTLSNDFSMYKFYGEVSGVKIDTYHKNDELEIDVDGLISYINSNNIAGLIFSNPCNPTSLCLTRENVLKIIQNVDALVVVDEAYMDFSDQSVLDCCDKYDNVIILKTCSKAIGLAAIRLGFAVANDTLTTALKAVKSPYNVNSITQCIGEIVLTDVDYIRNCTEKLIANRDYLYSKLQELHSSHNFFDKIYKPETNFVFVKTSYAEFIYNELLIRSIAIRCMGEYLRISAGSIFEIDELFVQLREIFEKNPQNVN